VKVLLAADLQIEAGQAFGHGEYGEGSRFCDQQQMLSLIAGIAEQEGVELTILAGDTFDRPKPSPWAILALKHFLDRQDGRTIIIAGNHDVKSLALPSVIECFKGESVDVFDSPGVVAAEPLRISVLPWCPVGTWTVRDDFPHDRDEQNAYIGSILGNTAAGLGAHTSPDGWRHILIGHWSIAGAATSAGLSAEVFREPLIPLESLVNAGFDMVAFGHIHAIQVLNETPPVMYLGSPWANTFGEAGHPHGVWIYDTEKPEMRFVPVEDRPILTVNGDVESLQDVIANRDLEGAVIRVRYTVDESDLHEEDPEAVRKELIAAGCSKVFLQPQVIKASRARVEEPVLVDGLDPSGALDLFLRTDGTDPDRSDRARELHSEMTAKL
jgi:DNA repair exonuclease SbcCD nuclease subunit